MASMLVQIKVKDFAGWKKVFDSGSELRRSNGAIYNQIFQDAYDPNKVTVLYEWSSTAEAQKFSQSQALRDAMMEAGVQGPPEVQFLNKA